MKAAAWGLLVALVVSPVAAQDMGPEDATAESSLPVTGAEAPTTPAPPPLGVLPAVTAVVETQIPKECLIRLPQGDFVIAESVAVRYAKGVPLVRVAEEPEQGEFRARLDGAIRFSKQDAGKPVGISYEYCPRRLAILSVECDTNYEDAAPILRQALNDELGKRGLVIVGEDDVADAMAGSGGGPGWSPDQLAALARRLQAAYLLRPGVAAEEGRLLAGSIGQVGTIGSHAVVTTTPVVKNTMAASRVIALS